MAPTVRRVNAPESGQGRAGDRRGFTLVEMMIALIILSISVLGLASVILSSMQVNLATDLRNGAVRVTGELVEQMVAQKYGLVTSGGEDITLAIRGNEFLYNSTWVVKELMNSKQIELEVQYDLRGVSKTNTTVFYKHNDE